MKYCDTVIRQEKKCGLEADQGFLQLQPILEEVLQLRINPASDVENGCVGVFN